MVTVVPKSASFNQYNLKLNEFDDNVTMTWQDLQVDNNFYDLTLACDGKQIHIHKVVVSSVCPIVKRILKQNKDEHPLIYLSGFKFEDLENLVKFMYQGEVKIAQKDLNSFLDVAEYLQIEGLMKEIVETTDFPQIMHSSISSQPKENLKDNDIKKVITLDKSKYDTDSIAIRNDSPNKIINVAKETALLEKYNPIGSDCNMTVPNINDHILHDDLSDKQPKELRHSTETKLALEQKKKTEKINKADFSCQNMKAQDEGVKEGYDLTSSTAPIAKVNSKSRAQFSDDSHNYFCMKCNQKYSTMRTLKNHEDSAHYEIRYKCKYCDKKFSSTYTLKAHADSVHEGISFQCGQCNFKAMSKLTLKRHIAAIHENVRFTCDQCNFKAKSRGYIKRHVDSIHKGIRYQCDDCNKKFVEPLKLRRHVESIHEGIRYPCNSCDYFATDKYSLKRHKKNHEI